MVARFHSAEESTAAALGPPAWLVDILLAAEVAATLKRSNSDLEVAAELGRKVPPRISHGRVGDVPEAKTVPHTYALEG